MVSLVALARRGIRVRNRGWARLGVCDRCRVRARRRQRSAKLLHPRQVSSKRLSGALGRNKLQAADRDKSASKSAPSCGWDGWSKDFDRGDGLRAVAVTQVPVQGSCRIGVLCTSVGRWRSARSQNMFLSRTVSKSVGENFIANRTPKPEVPREPHVPVVARR